MRDATPASRDIGSRNSSPLSPTPSSGLSTASLSDTYVCSSPLTSPSPYEEQSARGIATSDHRVFATRTDTFDGSAEGSGDPQGNTEETFLKQEILELKAKLARKGGEVKSRMEQEGRRWRDECARAAIASQQKIDKLQSAIANRDAALPCART